MTVAERFGANLAHHRERVGLTQEELGVRASLHRTAVGQLERGERTACLDSFVKLAGSLHVNPLELLEGIAWEPGGTLVGRFGFPEEDGRAS